MKKLPKRRFDLFGLETALKGPKNLQKGIKIGPKESLGLFEQGTSLKGPKDLAFSPKSGRRNPKCYSQTPNYMRTKNASTPSHSTARTKCTIERRWGEARSSTHRAKNSRLERGTRVQCHCVRFNLCVLHRYAENMVFMRRVGWDRAGWVIERKEIKNTNTHINAFPIPSTQLHIICTHAPIYSTFCVCFSDERQKTHRLESSVQAKMWENGEKIRTETGSFRFGDRWKVDWPQNWRNLH